MYLKYFSSFVAVKLAKKNWGQSFVNKWLPSLFFANFTAMKDEKYFTMQKSNFKMNKKTCKSNKYSIIYFRYVFLQILQDS